MKKAACVCGSSMSSGHLLCRGCWWGLTADQRSAVNETYREAKGRAQVSGRSLRDELLAHQGYRAAAMDARRSARAAAKR